MNNNRFIEISFVHYRMNEPITKWWFYIYKAIDEFINTDTVTNEKEFLTTIKTFMLQSNLAEYEKRLELLYTFHCHVIHLIRTKRTEIVVNVLWNAHQYFMQFLPNILDKIKDLRTPIEKKLKDYVKIVRWKDISYWAIKETLIKTHKTLHKHMREYEDVLKQPVLAQLRNVTSKSLENVGIWDRPQRQLPKSYHYSMDPSMYMAKKSHSKVSAHNIYLIYLFMYVLQKVQEYNKNEKFFNRSRILCKNTISKTKYPKLIQSLDTFTGELIESIQHYQKLDVDRTLPKNKQKSQAKSFLQQKQRGLADLFKTLTKIGISFKTGVVECKLKDNTTTFLLKPLDLEASFSHLNYVQNDEKILTIWKGCEMYYSRSLIRLDILEVALKTPSKELSLQVTERCKGFAFNLTVSCTI